MSASISGAIFNGLMDTLLIETDFDLLTIFSEKSISKILVTSIKIQCHQLQKLLIQFSHNVNYLYVKSSLKGKMRSKNFLPIYYINYI